MGKEKVGGKKRNCVSVLIYTGECGGEVEFYIHVLQLVDRPSSRSVCDSSC